MHSGLLRTSAIVSNAFALSQTVNVFKGVLNNPLFCTIWTSTAVLQVIIVQYGSVAFAVVDGGLDGKMWGLSMALGAGALPVQKVINLLYAFGSNVSGHRNRKRLEKDRQMVKVKKEETESLIEHLGDNALVTSN